MRVLITMDWYDPVINGVVTPVMNLFCVSYSCIQSTYVRQVDKLLHITINGEEIVTIDNYPFYVQGRGFREKVC